MSLQFENYWPAFLLLLIPVIWYAQRQTLTDLSPKHLRLAGIIRGTIVGLLALALMQPVLMKPGVWTSVIYLLDVSQSVSPASIQSSIQWIQKTNSSGSPAHSKFIPFGANSSLLDSVEQLQNVKVAGYADKGSIDQSATNIEDAVDRALSSFAPHHLKRLVLISDGNENNSHVSDLLPRLKQEGVRVYTLPVSARTNRDTWVEAIMAPSRVTAEELFPVDVHVYSQVEGSAEIELKGNSKTLGKRDVHLTKGLNRVAFDAHLKDETGPVTLEASVKIEGDPFPDNNTYRESIVVEGKPKVLYVESHRESAKYLNQALTQEGFAVDIADAAQIPSEVDKLNPYDLIVLSDVDKASLNDAQMHAIATYVRDLGGGFILAGGENNYGEGGYAKTLIEDILPVTFEAKKEKPSTLGMIVVLDKSGSMGGPKIELAKEATKAPLDLMKDTDKFGVVAFDYNYYWAVNFDTVGEHKDAMTQAVSSIMAGGETNIYPALREAYIKLAGGGTQVKHIILLSDGRSLPDDYEGLVTKMADSKITVSTVAVGTGADRELLANIATWGKGRSYYLEDPSRVPQIFTSETEMAAGRTLHEDPFKAIVKKNVEAFKGIDFNNAPKLLGYVSTKAKPTSEVLLEAPAPDPTQPNDQPPILARWQYGLGQTAAFTSDVKDRWSVDWLRWNGYSKFWSQLVRETMRRRDDESFDFQVQRVNDEAQIQIHALDKDGQFRDKMQSQVRVIAPDQSSSVVDVHQVGPGSYEASFPLNQKGPYLFRAVGDDTGGAGASRLLPYSYPDEYHFYPPNVDLLQALSSETGGAFQPAARDIFDAKGETTTLPIPLWPYLAAIALALYLADVLLRRIRLFES